MIIKEFCAENLTDLHRLQAPEINRVELCDNLAMGGTTPSYGVIKEANRLLHEKGITSAVMIRPRGGDFVYNDLELRAMEEDILKAVELESDYLVLGLLTKDNQLDTDGIEQLLPACQGVPLVFHMAFDQIPKDQQTAAIDQLISYGFVRILLHGSVIRGDLSANAQHIKELIQYADGRIEIMIGGGVTAQNVEELCRLTGTRIAHGTGLLST